MAEIMNGLFGMNPQMLQQQRFQEDDAQAFKLAQMSPLEQSNFHLASGARGLGRYGAGMLGAKDPELENATAMQRLAQESDLNTPEGLLQFAQKIKQFNPQASLMAVQKAQELRLSTAKADKEVLSMQQEKQLRSELAALPPGSTDADILAVVTKYGDADKIIGQLNTNINRQEDRQVRFDAAKQAAQDRMDQLRYQAEQQMERLKESKASDAVQAAMQRQLQLQLKDSELQMRKYLGELAVSLKAEKPQKPLSSALQKSEDSDLGEIDGIEQQKNLFGPVLQSLKPDPKTGKSVLELGALQNLQAKGRNALGVSDTQSQAYARLERAVQEATNILVAAEKGVQTDADVVRMANQLVAAFGKNDTKVMTQALAEFMTKAETRKGDKRKIINSRRKSQGIDAYEFGDTPTTFNSIQEAEAAKLPKGTTIIINGRKAVVE